MFLVLWTHSSRLPSEAMRERCSFSPNSLASATCRVETYLDSLDTVNTITDSVAVLHLSEHENSYSATVECTIL